MRASNALLRIFATVVALTHIEEHSHHTLGLGIRPSSIGLRRFKCQV